MPGPAPSTAIASTVPTNRRRAIASNPNKLLLDPYARQVIGKLTWNPALFGYKMESGPILPGTVLVDEAYHHVGFPAIKATSLSFSSRGAPHS